MYTVCVQICATGHPENICYQILLSVQRNSKAQLSSAHKHLQAMQRRSWDHELVLNADDFVALYRLKRKALHRHAHKLESEASQLCGD